MRDLIQEPKLRIGDDITSSLSYGWRCVRMKVIVPLLHLAIFLCAVMSIMLFLERLYMAIVIICVKMLKKKRYTKYNWESMKDDLQLHGSYPMVLIQIPMFNEKEVQVAPSLWFI